MKLNYFTYTTLVPNHSSPFKKTGYTPFLIPKAYFNLGLFHLVHIYGTANNLVEGQEPFTVAQRLLFGDFISSRFCESA